MIKSFYINKLNIETPYSYQIRVAELLLSGKNVILSVPTGAGKTWASVMPFLYAQENNRDFPKKMIYSLPLRALVNSIHEDVKDIANKVSNVSIQTGEFSEDKFFEKDIIFSTIDQTLSNFLCFPLPLSHRQANINAGALIGSYLVFDEFHLLDTERSMATALGTLKMLGNLCRCCIMTATLSQDFMKALKENLPNYEIVTLEDFPEDQNKIASLLPAKDKKKVTVLDETISAQVIAKQHRTKTIVICNRVETAQKIYKDLTTNLRNNEGLKGLEEGNIICLHSRFFDQDRKEKESRLKELFGKNADQNEQALLIATQVIEAGMDISCDIMHTEISPVNSFLQRAGRCARFKDEKGQIFIYEVLGIEEKERIQLESDDDKERKEIQKLNNKYLPYEPKICKATFDALQVCETLDNDKPQKLIEDVLKEKEQETIKRLIQGYFNYNKIFNSWSDCQKNNYRNTIRDIQSVEVTIINDAQCEEVAQFPYRYQSLGMYKFSLVGWLNKIVKGNEDNPPPKELETDDWLIKKLVEAEDLFLENDEDIKYELKEIQVEEFNSLPAQVYVNAKYFGYSENFGFNWQYSDTFNHYSPKREKKDKENDFDALKKDTFYQHNKALIGAFEVEFLGKNQDKLDFAFKELAHFIGKSYLQKEDFIRLIKLMIALHDYGKLNETWQKPMQYYQAIKEGIEPEEFNEILGHTDFDKKDTYDLELEKKCNLKSRGKHAGVGAFISLLLLGKNYQTKEDFLKILSPLATAIIRHHSPLSSSVNAFNISDKNFKAFLNLYEKEIGEFEYEKLDRLQKYDKEQNLEKYLVKRENKISMMMYFFFVRILRLCDQKATENMNGYIAKYLR